jgi:hypothetical protein
MQAHQANLINAIVLLVVGLWGYAANNFNSHTAIVPLGAGLLFLVLNTFLKDGNRHVAHLVVILTLVLAIALFWPLKRNMDQADTIGTLRVGIEIVSCLFALGVFIKSFIDNRKLKSNA